MEILEITSRDNPTFRELLKLAEKKGRWRMGKCIIEGEKIVRENLGIAEKVFVRKGKTFDYPHSGEPGFSAEHLSGVVALGTKLFDEVSSLENSTGVLAIVPKPDARALTFPYLILDGIQDPGNAGVLLRSALAFGFETVYCVDCVDMWSPKVLRASSGVQFNLNIVECGYEDYIKPAHSCIIAADLDGESLEDFKIKDTRFGLVLGSEGNGVSKKMKDIVSKVVTIPMSKTVESLNVGVAGGILMYALAPKCEHR